MPECDSPSAIPDIVALVLAAGQGSRFDTSGKRYKPVQPLADGTAMVYAVCHTLLEYVPDITVVCGPHEQAIRDALRGLPVTIVHCADANQGMSASLRCGISQSPADKGWIIALADMPLVNKETVQKIATRLRDGARIVRPQYHGMQGHPVGFANRFRDELLAIAGDEGARAIIRKHSGALECIPVNDPGCLIDIDTEEQLLQYGSGIGS